MKDEITSRTMGWVAGTLLTGMVLSVVLAWHQSQTNQRRAKEAFASLTERVAGQITSRMRLYEYGLRGARGAVTVAGEQGITRSLFRRYSESRNIDHEFPGARGFGFVRRVPAEAQDEFTAAARLDGMPGFAIRALGAQHDGDRFVIQYIEPIERNRAAVGLDIGSEPNRRQAALTAMVTGQPIITGPITLAQASGERLRSVLFLLPVYRPGITPTTREQRRSATYGWAYAALSMKEVLADFHLSSGDFQMVLHDITRAGRPEAFYDTLTVAHKDRVVFTQTVERDVYGRRWQIELRATPNFVRSRSDLQPTTVFAAGALTTIMLAALVGAVRLGRDRGRRGAVQRAQLATIVENSADAIIGESMDGKVIIWNQAAERLFGYAAAEVMGESLAPFLLPPDRHHEETELMARIAQGGSLPPFDTTRLNRRGELMDVSITAGVIRSQTAEIVGIARLIRDIRERKESERRLRDFNLLLETQVHERTAELEVARRDLQTVLDAVPSMIGYWDKHLLNRVANRACSDWFGVPPDAIKGRHLSELLGPALFDDSRPCIEAALRGQALHFERPIARPDGQGVRQSRTHYLPDIVDGQVQGFYAIVHDITEQHSVETALREAKAAAESANAAKSMFLANMSHEIRTPMNAVIGVAHLLSTTSLDADQRQLLSKLQIAGRSLLGIINDVLDLAKIEAGEMSLDLTVFSPAHLLHDLQELFRPQAADKGITLESRGTASLPPYLLGDALRLQQILVNLVSNAIKFTPQGGVLVSVMADGTQGDAIWSRWSVKDTGLGMAPALLDTLFDPFTQADASTTRQFGGTGLGLSIVKRLVDLMGGQVGVDSVPGQGSEFWVRLPFVPAQGHGSSSSDRKGSPPDARVLAGLSILLVDDSEINLEVARRLLEREGATVRTANDALAALDILREGEAGQVDAVLMDVQMPGMDGYEATRRIRQELGLRSLPVLALTAGALGEERRRAEAAGMNDFVLKPIDPPALVRALWRSVVRSRPQPGHLAGEAPPAPEATRWPAIEGIDTQDAAHRLGHDHALFLKMLERFLKEFASDEQRIEDAPARPPEALVAHLHKLHGIAGSLGATQVRRLAQAAEAAVLDGAPAGEVSAHLQALGRALATLAAAARPVIDGWRAATKPPPTQHNPAHAAHSHAAQLAGELEQLAMLLRQQDLDAIEHHARLLPALRAVWGEDRLAQLQQALDEMDFARALALLADDA